MDPYLVESAILAILAVLAVVAFTHEIWRRP